MSEDSTQFIWIRSFTNSEDVKAKEAAFFGSPEWNAVMDHARSHIARTVVQTMEPAFNVSGDSLRRGPGKACELRIYTISRGMVEPWVKFHTDTLVPLHEKLGIRVEGSWVNEDNNQLIWIRTFDDAEDRKVKRKHGAGPHSGNLRGSSSLLTWRGLTFNPCGLSRIK